VTGGRASLNLGGGGAPEASGSPYTVVRPGTSSVPTPLPPIAPVDPLVYGATPGYSSGGYGGGEPGRHTSSAGPAGRQGSQSYSSAAPEDQGYYGGNGGGRDTSASAYFNIYGGQDASVGVRASAALAEARSPSLQEIAQTPISSYGLGDSDGEGEQEQRQRRGTAARGNRAPASMPAAGAPANVAAYTGDAERGSSGLSPEADAGRASTWGVQQHQQPPAAAAAEQPRSTTTQVRPSAASWGFAPPSSSVWELASPPPAAGATATVAGSSAARSSARFSRRFGGPSVEAAAGYTDAFASGSGGALPPSEQQRASSAFAAGLRSY
jgi:hypothetical protein